MREDELRTALAAEQERHADAAKALRRAAAKLETTSGALDAAKRDVQQVRISRGEGGFGQTHGGSCGCTKQSV